MFFQQLKSEQNYSNFRPGLFLSTGDKEKAGNEVTFDSRVSDKQSKTD